MASRIYHNRVRITTAATWTACALPDVGSELLIDFLIENWTANTNTVLVAIKTSAPSADTDASWKFVLAKSPVAPTDAGQRGGLTKLLLKDGEMLYVKSDQTDTRVEAMAITQVVP